MKISQKQQNFANIFCFRENVRENLVFFRENFRDNEDFHENLKFSKKFFVLVKSFASISRKFSWKRKKPIFAKIYISTLVGGSYLFNEIKKGHQNLVRISL
jgi:hypothetical protein